MKRLLVAACLLALPSALSAQSAVPGLITYQGKVTDAGGALIGSPSPTNRTIIFRVYDHATSVAAANRLHTEQQIVTIANGEFNVLVGAGSAVSGETFVATLDTVFTGASRYLGVTIDDNNGSTVDPEISPRQQIVTMPYAFRAKVAESVTGSAATSNIFQTTGNVGIGTRTPIAPLTLFSAATDAKFLLQTTASGATASDGLGIVQSNAAGYLLEYENLPLHLGTNSTTRMTIAANGYIGLGTQNPTAPVSLGVALGNTKLALWDDSTGGLYGMGVQGNQFRLHTNQTGDRFSFLSSTAGNEVFTIKSTGQVGIGIAAPIAPLQLYTADNNTSILLQHAGTGTTAQSGLGLIESNKGYLWQYSNLPLLIGTNGTTRMTFTAAGRVAIGGGENPGALLSLGGSTANTKLALWDNEGGAMYGLGMGANQLRFHANGTGDRFSFLSDAAGTVEVMTIKTSGQVGIGTPLPVGPLHIHTQTTDSRMFFTNQGTGSSASDGLTVGHDSSGAFFWNHEPFTGVGTANVAVSALRLATASTERLRIEGDGRMGFNASNGDGNIGYFFSTTGTSYMMVLQSHINGWRYSFENNGTATKWGGGSGWAIQSDARLKTNVAPLDGSLERLLKLRSVTFDWKDENIGKGQQTGFIAQEVQQVFPDWVKTTPSGTLSLEHLGFESHTVQALRELRAEKDTQLAARDRTIAAQDARIRDLEAQAKAADARMAAFERKLGALSLAAVTANSPR